MSVRGLSDLLFNGHVNGIQVGARIEPHKSDKDIILWQVQEGDIPAVYDFSFEGLKYEIASLQGTVVGITVKLDFYPDGYFRIQSEKSERTIDFGVKTNFIDFIEFLNELGVNWRVDEDDTGEKAIGVLLDSKTKVMYSFEKDFFGFYRVINFNLDLYQELRKEIL
ncbi:hypothetical protein [Chryseolinea soli]|uniref:Uncharacterized protein n=1 Tax=Chryseolinea soli TaxID=2321403 RepID=A0A385STN2_9BACT|nr:hypothetical protein [Chryseolinea soli]AYB33335.1 hypothetical protein D4L85_23320 [Chryseolinea soli]